jgi:hypothetical protein
MNHGIDASESIHINGAGSWIPGNFFAGYSWATN